MADLEQFRTIYFDECAELLASAEDGLLSLDTTSPDADTVNAIFRAVHSIKGGGGAFGFATLVDFAHRFEAVLNDLRNDRIALSRPLVDAMIAANDTLGALIVAAKEDSPPDDLGAEMTIESLKAIAYGDSAEEQTGAGPAALPTEAEAAAAQALLDAAFGEPEPETDAEVSGDESDGAADWGTDLGGQGGGADGETVWKIDFQPKPDLIRFGNEPLHLIRALGELGRTVVRCGLDRVPESLADYDPESVYLHWEIFLAGAATPADIEEVFEFAGDEADIEITPADPEEYAFARGWDVDYAGDEASFLESFHAADTLGEPDDGPDFDGLAASFEPEGPAFSDPPAAAPPPADPMPAGPGETDGPAPSAPPLSPSIPDSPAPPAAEPVGRPAVSSGTAVAAPPSAPSSASTVPAPGPAPQPSVGGARSAQGRSALGGQTIRVDLEKIDKLVNLVGEMVITQAMIAEQTRAEAFAGSAELVEGLDDLAQHTRELQDSVMAIRAQPVSSVFNRMPRLVREVAAETGKDVQLVVTGEGTEVDKTVVELLADPLVHMIRNSIDHGLEPTADRIALGKPPTGRVRLSAEHRSGRILIQISDDGRGIDRERVLAKAREKGLIEPDRQPSDDEIDNLIFLPGFSTADTVSAISGRGVGMDVVGRNIQALGGRIVVQSTPGEGSTFTLSLPLTLAVLDGMVVRIGEQRFVVPLTNIVESLRPTASLLNEMVDGNATVRVRGEYVRIVPVWKLFAIEGAIETPDRGLVVIAETEEGGRIGLLVDDIVGQQQVVIKSLEANYQQLPGVSAATILGDGRVALIVDIAGLREFNRQRQRGGQGSVRLLEGPVAAVAKD